jgi:molybdopterin-guanine dinucleotide biosynthesis protein A
MQRGAIILCGGKSSRMGTDKALLRFGSETMLERTLRNVAAVVDPARIVIVAAANQQLPSLKLLVVRDNAEHQGPLMGFAKGLEVLSSVTDAVLASGCDSPLLKSALIDWLFNQLGDAEAVVPQDDERLYPLCAVYRTNLLCQVRQQLNTGQRSLHRFVDNVDSRRLPVESFRKIDPGLLSLTNVNSQEDYLSALEAAGLPTP